MSEYGDPAVVLQVLVQAHAVAFLAQDAAQCCLADLNRLPAQVTVSSTI